MIDLANKKFKCPYCQKNYVDKEYLYDHMINEHEDELGGLSAAHAYFNFRYKKTKGRCIMCKRETKFNEETERYERLCSDKCSDDYRQQFKDRMNRKYGKDHLLNDEEQQKKMLANRRISGEYRWSDGEKKTFTGSYEKHALEFFDKKMGLKSKDVLSPSPITLDYKYDGEDRFYIPDFFIVPYNLLVEVKGTNNHYQKRDINQEKAKDKIAIESKYNYVKIVNKNYDGLISMIDKIKSV